MSERETENVDMDSYWRQLGRKPLPVQRILQENGGSRIKSKSCSSKNSDIVNGCSVTGLEDEDKENDMKEGSSSSTPGVLRNQEDSGDWFEQEPMSSTVMDKSSPDRKTNSVSSIFSTTDNISSISLSMSRSADLVKSERLFKTPKRRECQQEAQTLTPVSSVTSNEGEGRTRSSASMRTPSSGGGHSLGSSEKRWNPFDSQGSYNMLHQPTLSPNVFATVISPSQDTESNGGRFWSIEQQADMFPTDISDDSPLKQSLYIRHHSKDLENKTQEQISLYFAENHTVLSPPDIPPTGPLLLDSPEDASYSVSEKKTVSSWTQTSLTFPPLLPDHIESVLRKLSSQTPVCLSGRQTSLEEGPPAALSNSTLRRKLFNGESSSDEEEKIDGDRCQSPEELGERSSPCPGLTPGRVIHTPSQAWSSSPVRRMEGRATSFSPPDQLGSPMFSPIVKERLRKYSMKGSEVSEVSEDVNREYEENNEDIKENIVVDADINEVEELEQEGKAVEEMDSSNGRLVDNLAPVSPGVLFHRQETCPPSPLSLPPACHQNNTADMSGGETSLLYQTADSMESGRGLQEMDTDSNGGVCPAWSAVSHSNREAWEEEEEDTESRTGAGGGWTVSLLPDVTAEPGGSRADTGYSTNGGTSTNSYTSLEVDPHRSSSCQDSGASISYKNQTAGVSMLVPPVVPPTSAENGILLSYAGENCNDISVGFPLGSSTPTKK